MTRESILSFCMFALAAGCQDGKSTPTDTAEEGDLPQDTIEDAPDDTAADTFADADDAVDAVDEDGPAPVPSRFVLLHTNDEHSHLLGIGPGVDDWPLPAIAGDGSMKGGIYRRAIVLQRERAAAMDEGIPTLTVGAGDYTMGTFFHLGSAISGVDYKLMTLLDYDAVNIGNHEFDFGVATLATMLEEGGLFTGVPLAIPVISSNIHFSAGSGDDALQALYARDGAGGALLRGWYVHELTDGTRVGIIGYMGLDAALVAPFKSPLQFSLSFTAQACTASAECTDGSCVEGYCTDGALQDHEAHLPALVADVAQAVRDVRAQGVDVVVALAHAGLSDREAQAIIDGTMTPGEATRSEDILVAFGVEAELLDEGIEGIDLVVSAHTHTRLDEPIVLASPAGGGRTVTIVQAGDYGRFVGRVEMYREDVDAPWQVDLDGSRLIPVDDTIDPAELTLGMKSMIDQAVVTVIEAVEPMLLVDGINAFNPGTPVTDDTGVAGDLFFYTLAESQFDIAGESPHREFPLMHMVTDGMREVLNQGFFAADPVDVYVQANGVLRDPIMASRVDGALSMADVFNAVPLGVSPVEETPGFPLIDFYFTAAELKVGLEVGLSMGFDADSFFLGYSGVKVEYDPNLPALDMASPMTTGRITKMTLYDGVADASLMPWEDGYSDVIFDLTVTPDPFAGRGEEILHVATNLYIGLYIENFGLCPRDASGTWDPLCGLCDNDDADCVSALGTATCVHDAVSAGVGRCVGASVPAVIGRIVHDPVSTMEVKEWVALAGYLMNLPDSDADTIPDVPAAYDGDDAAGAVPSRICCTKLPSSATDLCCHAEPCADDFIACD